MGHEVTKYPAQCSLVLGFFYALFQKKHESYHFWLPVDTFLFGNY